MVGMPYHSWTRYELTALLGLMVKGEHLAGDLNMATKLNEALNRSEYDDDIEIKEVAFVIKRILKECPTFMCMLNRSSATRLTSTLKAAFFRALEAADLKREQLHTAQEAARINGEASGHVEFDENDVGRGTVLPSIETDDTWAWGGQDDDEVDAVDDGEDNLRCWDDEAYDPDPDSLFVPNYPDENHHSRTVRAAGGYQEDASYLEDNANAEWGQHDIDHRYYEAPRYRADHTSDWDASGRHWDNGYRLQQGHVSLEQDVQPYQVDSLPGYIRGEDDMVAPTTPSRVHFGPTLPMPEDFEMPDNDRFLNQRLRDEVSNNQRNRVAHVGRVHRNNRVRYDDEDELESSGSESVIPWRRESDIDTDEDHSSEDEPQEVFRESHVASSELQQRGVVAHYDDGDEMESSGSESVIPWRRESDLDNAGNRNSGFVYQHLSFGNQTANDGFQAFNNGPIPDNQDGASLERIENVFPWRHSSDADDSEGGSFDSELQNLTRAGRRHHPYRTHLRRRHAGFTFNRPASTRLPYSDAESDMEMAFEDNGTPFARPRNEQTTSPYRMLQGLAESRQYQSSIFERPSDIDAAAAHGADADDADDEISADNAETNSVGPVRRRLRPRFRSRQHRENRFVPDRQMHTIVEEESSPYERGRQTESRQELDYDEQE